ncbi:hypothetical protein [Priestia aryabhattai]|uniref:hypothetical protein n=1 Tax=Priestia aryabhattai TaxID=412384 RepID=UPI003D2865FF
MGYCCRFIDRGSTVTRTYQKYGESVCPAPLPGYTSDTSWYVASREECEGGARSAHVPDIHESDEEYFNKIDQMKAQHSSSKNL